MMEIVDEIVEWDPAMDEEIRRRANPDDFDFGLYVSQQMAFYEAFGRGGGEGDDPLPIEMLIDGINGEPGAFDHLESTRNAGLKMMRFLGSEIYAECMVCLERKSVYKRLCCLFPVCISCLKLYYEMQVSNAVIKIRCIGTDCKKYVERDEILLFLDNDLKLKFRKFIIDANREPHRKTCPGCNHVTEVNPTTLKESGKKKYGFCVMCSECNLEWCFSCQAPWHDPLTCNAYQRGDRLFKSWTKEREAGQANAQKCPNCKVYIQRSSGCDHMICSKCKTNFCYQCGEKYREFKFVGSHHSRLSILGCKYRFKPNSPIQRKLIRGSIFGGKLLAAPVVGGLALGAGVVVAGVGLVVLPFYGSYKLHKFLKKRRKEKSFRCALKEFKKWKETVGMTRTYLEPSDVSIATSQSSTAVPFADELSAVAGGNIVVDDDDEDVSKSFDLDYTTVAFCDREWLDIVGPDGEAADVFNLFEMLQLRCKDEEESSPDDTLILSSHDDNYILSTTDDDNKLSSISEINYEDGESLSEFPREILKKMEKCKIAIEREISSRQEEENVEFERGNITLISSSDQHHLKSNDEAESEKKVKKQSDYISPYDMVTYL